MKRCVLKNMASKVKDPSDISKYKSQRAFFVKMKKEVKLNYFDNIEPGRNSIHLRIIVHLNFQIRMLKKI